jgi:hypothetical protein
MENAITPVKDNATANPNGSSNPKGTQLPAHIQTDRGLASVNLFNPTELAAAETLMEKLMRSEKGGIKSVNEGISILLRAKDLNLPFSTCIEHIHVINGKTGVDIHVIKALLLRAACHWECLEDYQALYEYTDGFNVYNENNLPDYCIRCNTAKEALDKASNDADGEHMYVYPVRFYKDINGNIYRDYQLNANRSAFQIISHISQAKAVVEQKKMPVFLIPAVPIDYITKYKIYRKVGDEWMSSIGSFTYSEAVAAGLLEKDTYKKYARILIQHRAFTYAARDIASDILFGVMETTELKVVAGIPIDEQDVIEVDAIKEEH